MAKITHWHILGAGSIGCLWAFYFQKAGHQVTLIAKNKQHEDELRLHLPLTVIINGEEFHTDPEITCPELANLEKKPFISHLLICVKSYQTDIALKNIAHCINHQTTIVLMQNGMIDINHLMSIFPNNAIYVGITTEAAFRQKTLCVEHTGFGATQIGAISDIKNDTLMEAISCDLTTDIIENIEADLWKKLVVSCCINPLTVLFNCKNGDLTNNSNAQVLMTQIIAECRLVASAMHKQHYLNNSEEQLHQIINATAKNTSSMLQDSQNKRMTEIDSINGFIIKSARKYNIATPINDMLLSAIKKH